MTAFLATARRDRIALYFQHGEGWGREEAPEAGQWPAWQPDRNAYATSVVDRAAQASRIEVRSPRHELIGTPFRSTPGEPIAIGPRVPHYVSWSPNGRTLSYVAATGAGLSQFVAGLHSLDAPKTTLVGAPIFSTWFPDGDRLLVHVGDRLVVVDAESGANHPLSEAAIGFRAPAVSSDGSMVAYCRRASEGIDLCVGEPTGGQSHRIASFTGGVVVAFRPSSPHVTVASASDPSSGMFDALELIPATGGPRRRVWQGPFVSFGWDPTGGQLVLVVPTQTGDGRYALYALDAGGGLLAATDGFLPSDESRAAFAFFDQYLQSHCAWSPDGSVIGIAGRLASDSVSSSLGDIAGPFALLWEPRPGVPLKLVGPATFVSFAPAAVNNR